MKTEFYASMSGGPRLYSFRDKIYFYGAYHLLEFTEQERGKTLIVTVDSKQVPVCWIELWPQHYDGKDWVNWTTLRGQEAIVRTESGGFKPQPNPRLTWKIEPGKYTLYFVNSSLTDKVSDYVIFYQVEVK